MFFGGSGPVFSWRSDPDSVFSIDGQIRDDFTRIATMPWYIPKNISIKLFLYQKKNKYMRSKEGRVWFSNEGRIRIQFMSAGSLSGFHWNWNRIRKPATNVLVERPITWKVLLVCPNCSMVLISDGNLEHVAYVGRKTDLFWCVTVLDRNKLNNQIRYPRSLHMCAPISELQSNLSTM